MRESTLEAPSTRDVELAWKDVDEPAPSTVRFDGARVASFDVGPWLCEILELRFSGEYRPGSQGSPDAEAMMLHVTAMLARIEPDVVVLDLHGLRYTWGDAMLRVLEAIARFDSEHPVGVAIWGGPESSSALESLGLRVHVDEAMAHEDAKAQAVRRSVAIG